MLKSVNFSIPMCVTCSSGQQEPTCARSDDCLLAGQVIADWLKGRDDYKHSLCHHAVYPTAVLKLIQRAADHEICIQQKQHLQEGKTMQFAVPLWQRWRQSHHLGRAPIAVDMSWCNALLPGLSDMPDNLPSRVQEFHHCLTKTAGA